MRNDRVPIHTRCIDCSTVSAIACMPLNITIELRKNHLYIWLILKSCLNCSLKKEISAHVFTSLKSSTNQSLSKGFLKLLPHPGLIGYCTLRIALHDCIPLGRYQHRINRLPCEPRLRSIREGIHSLRIQVPSRKQPIARQTDSIRSLNTVISPVKIRGVRFDNRAQTIEIEMRVT